MQSYWMKRKRMISIKHLMEASRKLKMTGIMSKEIWNKNGLWGREHK